MGERTEIEHSKLNMASYGFGKFLTEFMEMAFTVWLYFFYTDTIGVDSLIIGLAVVVYAIWNAVNDPLVGYLTNKPFKFTKKWGRRFPWSSRQTMPPDLFSAARGRTPHRAPSVS